MSSAGFETEAWVPRLRSLAVFGWVAIGLAGVYGLMAGAMGFAEALVFAGAFAAVCSRVRLGARVGRQVRIDAQGIHVAGVLRVPAITIDEIDVRALPRDEDGNTATPFPGAHAVFVKAMDDTYSLAVASREAAEALASTIRSVVPSTARAQFVAPSRRVLGAAAAAVLVLGAVGAAWSSGEARYLLAVYAVAAATGLLASRQTPIRARVAASGVALRRFGRARVLAMADVARWTTRLDEKRRCHVLRLRTRDRRRVDLLERLVDAPEAPVLGAVATLRAELERYAPQLPEGPRSPVALVRRQGRSVAAWVRALRELGAARPDYRAAPLDREALWRVVVDPFAPEDARVGAAVAVSDDAEARVRIANIAEAEPKGAVRVALQAVAADDDVVHAVARVRATAD